MENVVLMPKAAVEAVCHEDRSSGLATWLALWALAVSRATISNMTKSSTYTSASNRRSGELSESRLIIPKSLNGKYLSDINGL